MPSIISAGAKKQVDTRDSPAATPHPETGLPGGDAGGCLTLIASPGASFRSRLKGILNETCPTREVSHWESLDRTISSLLPSVVLLDMDLLSASGLTDLSVIRRIGRKSRIILLSGQPSDEEGVSGFRAGARGYCAKDLDAALLRKAVLKVHDGEIWAERRLIPLVVERCATPPGEPPGIRLRPDRRLALLTPREREIARLIGAGASNRDIAARLAVGEKTVKAHLTAIFRKLGFTDRLQLGLFLASPDSKDRKRH